MKRLSPTILSFLAIGFLALLVYAPSLQGGFHWDDNVFIVKNPDIRDVSDIRRIWNTDNPGRSRFLALYTFAWNFHFSELNALAYRLTNIAIHIGAALLVWWFMRMVLPLRRGARSPAEDQTIALFAAFIFVAHPLQTQAVAYISQRMESLAAFFYLLSVCLYVKARLSVPRRLSIICYSASALAAVLGMFTKEIVITLPAAILLVEFLLLRKDGKKAAIHPLFWAALGSGALIVPALFSFKIAGTLFEPRPSMSHVGDTVTFGTYILTQCRVFFTFLRLLFVPVHQNVDYDFALSRSLIDPLSTLGSLVVLAAVFYAGLALYKRERLLSFGIFWFFIVLSANLVPRQYVIFEHKLYLVTAGFAVFVTVALARLIKDPQKYLQTLSVIIAVLSVLTFERNQVWTDTVSLWRDTVKKSPNKAMPHHNLGAGYANEHQFDAALLHFTRAIELDPAQIVSYSYRGNMYMNTGAPALALKDYQKALAIDPNFAEALFNLGVYYQKQGNADLALENYNKAIAGNRQYLKAYNNRSVIFRQRGQFEKALADADRAIYLSPESTKLYFTRATIFEATGKEEAALADYDRALTIRPVYQPAYFNRAELHRRHKRYAKALSDFEKAAAFQPGNKRVYFQRGLTYIMMENYEAALRDYDRILAIDPKFFMAHYQKANIYNVLGDARKADQEYAMVSKLAPAGTLEKLERSRLGP